MEAGEIQELWQTGHGSVVIEDLADDAHGEEAGYLSQVHGGFSVTSPLEHATIFGTQGEYVTRLNQIAWDSCWRSQHLDGFCPIGSTDACGDSMCGIDADLEVGFELITVFGDHAFNSQLAKPVLAGRHTDESPAEARHEIDGFGGYFLGSHNEIPLIFPVFVIDDNNHFAGPNIDENVFNGVERIRNLSHLRGIIPEHTDYSRSMWLVKVLAAGYVRLKIV